MKPEKKLQEEVRIVLLKNCPLPLLVELQREFPELMFPNRATASLSEVVVQKSPSPSKLDQQVVTLETLNRKLDELCDRNRKIQENEDMEIALGKICGAIIIIGCCTIFLW